MSLSPPVLLIINQISAVCNGINGFVSPYVVLDPKNNTDPNTVYHDFRVTSNDSRPDWYFESMTVMRWNNRVGWLGITPKSLTNLASTGRSIGVYDGIVYDVTDYKPTAKGTYNTAPPNVDT